MRTCDGCEKSITSELDVPTGWFSIDVEHGADDFTGEEDTALVCSVPCATRWFERTWGEPPPGCPECGRSDGKHNSRCPKNEPR